METQLTSATRLVRTDTALPADHLPFPAWLLALDWLSKGLRSFTCVSPPARERPVWEVLPAPATHDRKVRMVRAESSGTDRARTMPR